MYVRYNGVRKAVEKDGNKSVITRELIIGWEIN